MNKKQVMALLTMTTLMLSIYLPSVPTALAIEIPREELIWGEGYWPELVNFNPIRAVEGMGWDTYVMYDTLFGLDVASGYLTKWLGESIKWLNPTTIEVKLRPGLYWVKISPANWARWQADDPKYDPEYYRPIDAEDVKYSYLLTGAFTESNPLAWYMDGFKTRVGSMDNFETWLTNPALDHRTFRVHIDPGYPSSDVVYRTMTSDFIYIVPKDIWEQIDAETPGGYMEFTNDWLAPDFNPEWRVASGMYLTWWRDDLLTQTIMKKNDNWWGIPVLGRQPAPKYMGYMRGIENIDIPPLLKDGTIDWAGPYVPGINDTSAYPWSHTYFENQPFFADGATLAMVPNHRNWPIGEPWLDWAIAYVLDYKALSDVASSYCVDGSKYTVTYYGKTRQIQYPSALLIPKDDALGNKYLLDYPNKDNYLVGNNNHTTAEALALLDTYCYKKGGVWYTDAGPTAAWAQKFLDYYGDIDLTVGNDHTHPASYWIAHGFAEADDDLDTPGVVNVALGPWEIIDIDGWTDVCAKDGVAADLVTTELGIPLGTHFLDWDGYITMMDENTFDFCDYCMMMALNGNLYERYMQFFWGTYSGAWAHYGSYVNTNLEALIETLDTPLTDAQKQAVANQIFDIVGTDLPIIPLSGAPDWYVYSNKYWQRWPNEKHAFQPCSPYGGEHDLYILLSIGQLVPHDPLTWAPTDINNDRKVNIKDIATAAKAFGSFPGHPRWEFVADIMPIPAYGDGKVDIKDIARIAKDFGISY